MASRLYDLVVVGAGSGGVACARRAAARGARVAIVERGRVGGTCVNAGCIPKKLYAYAAHFRSDVAAARNYGWDLPEEPRLDWQKLKQAKNAEIARLNGIYERMLRESGVERIEGHATLGSASQVVVNGGELTLDAKNVLVAVGGRPHLPEGVPEGALTSDNVLEFSDDNFAQLPQSVAVVGGGYVACEFASFLSRLGVPRVAQFVRGGSVLRGWDNDLCRLVGENLANHAGVDLRLNTPAPPHAELEANFGRVVYATGRVPLTAGLGLEDAAGVELDSAGAVVVDEYSRSVTAPNVFAVGDCSTHGVNLTPAAIQQARALVETLFGGGAPVSGRRALTPSAVFTQPEAASVGLSEVAANRELGSARVRNFVSKFRPLKNTIGGSDERVFMKLVVDTETDRVIGCHVVGDGAAETIQTVAVAMNAGATKRDFDTTLAVHPTTAEELVLM